MELSFLEIFVLIGIIHSFILGCIILSSKFFRSKETFYLGISLIIISITGLNNWFWDLNQHPFIISISDLFLWQFLYPVTFYFYFLSASKKKLRKNHKYFIFYLPFIFLSFLNIVISLDTVFNLYQIPVIDNTTSLFYKLVSFLSIVFPVIMLLLSYKHIFKNQLDTNYKWLKLLWVFVSFLIVYSIVLEGFRFLFGEKKSLTYLWVAASILIYWLIYIGLFKFRLSNEKFIIRQILNSKNVVVTRKDIQQNQYMMELERMIREEKIHHNPYLSRDIVAQKLEISSGYLSQLINTTFGKNFSEYINFYRIKDIKKMILDPEFNKYSLLAIGLEAGFQSKTTFYTAFKKETGITPSNFKKAQNKF